MKRFYEPDNEQAGNLAKKAALVTRNPEPNGYSLLNTYSVGKSQPNDLVELAMDIDKADSFVYANACNKLQVISQQIRHLQKTAQNVLMETKKNMALHHAACNFVKVPGNIYHMYERTPQENYFSILSPQEWVKCPHKHLGSFRLEHDHSWTPVENIQDKDEELSYLKRFLPGNECNDLLRLQNNSMEM